MVDIGDSANVFRAIMKTRRKKKMAHVTLTLLTQRAIKLGIDQLCLEFLPTETTQPKG